MFYRSMWWLCRFLAFCMGGVRYEGRERIPKEGAFLVAANHRSSLDPFLVGLGTKRVFAFLAKDTLFRYPVIRTMLRWVHASPLKRGAGAKGVLEQSVEILKHGRPLMIFPEGQRNKTDALLLEFKKGTALLAVEAGVPILPAAVFNSAKAFGRKRVVYGSLIQPPKDNDKHSRDALTAELQEAIANLLLGGKKED